jgi:UDP-GlcNAc:undecaprenyl-phosphate GlcNAc-1-phosphate transferase
MNLFINGYNIFLIVLVSFLFSTILTPIVRKLAIRIGAVDKPDGKRKIHNKVIPSMGGLAFYISFLLGYLIFGIKTAQMTSILIGSFILIIFGIVDDIKALTPKTKLIGQIAAACVAVFFGHTTFESVQLFGHVFQVGWLSYPISILFIVAIINAINLSDGLDGLAAGASTIYFITIAVISFIMSQLGGLDLIICLIMIGSCLGFLVYNFPPANVFMGDTGSMFLGYIISVVGLLGFKTETFTSLIIPMLLLFVPILDTILAMLRRMLKGKSISSADKEHLHHQLLKTTHSQKTTVLIMYAINSLFAVVSVLYSLGKQKSSILVYGILLVLFVILIFKTNILFDRSGKDED